MKVREGLTVLAIELFIENWKVGREGGKVAFKQPPKPFSPVGTDHHTNRASSAVKNPGTDERLRVDGWYDPARQADMSDPPGPHATPTSL